MTTKELKTIKDFERLLKGDYVAVSFVKPIKDGNKSYDLKAFKIHYVDKEKREIILKKKNNIYFNYGFFISGYSNVSSAMLIRKI